MARKSLMNASALLHKRKTLFLVLLFFGFAAFTVDILDLREDIHLLSCPYSSLDNNVTTGMISAVNFAPGPVELLCAIQRKLSVKISFLHLLPCGFRAPPSWS
jgi:hypothetical protein